MRARSEMSASVIPSAKYSWAGSLDMLRSGSTASERIRSAVMGGTGVLAVRSRSPRRTSLTCRTEAGRRAASLLRHSATRRSSSSGASDRIERTAGGAVLRIWNISASERSESNGRRPVAISKSMTPKA